MIWTPKTLAGKCLATAAGIAASLTAIVVAYKTLDLPMPAWAEDVSRDIGKLNRRQADTAIEVYQNKYRSFLALPKPNDPTAQRAWDIEIERSLKQLEAAEQRKIELAR